MMYKQIQEVYAVFSKYPKPSGFVACEHCWAEVEKRDLLKPELTDVSPELLGNYVMSAFCTAGDLPDFKYFLPRILELSVTDNRWWPDPEIVLARLRLADWEDWPENERSVICALLNAKFRLLLKDPDTEREDIDSWICALSRCVNDITPYLNLLTNEAGEDRILAFIESNQTALIQGKLGNAFWDSHRSDQRILDWFNSEPVKQLLSKSIR